MHILHITEHFWTNPYYTNLEPLQNRINVGDFEGKVYKTPEQIMKEMKGYNNGVPKIQGYVEKHVDVPVFKYADEYYRIALNGVKDVGENNVTYKLYEVPDKELIKFIQQYYKVPTDIDVVTPTAKSSFPNAIKNTREFRSVLRKNLLKISNDKISHVSVNFSYKPIVGEKVSTFNKYDVFGVLGKAELYDPYIDKYGNLHILLVDYYDYEKLNLGSGYANFVELINNNAYIQQELGQLKNYVIIVPIEMTSLEIWEYLIYEK